MSTRTNYMKVKPAIRTATLLLMWMAASIVPTQAGPTGQGGELQQTYPLATWTRARAIAQLTLGRAMGPGSDLVGATEVPGKDGKPDVVIELIIVDPRKTIVGVEIINPAEKKIWDTIPDNGLRLVVMQSKGQSLKNKKGEIYFKPSRVPFPITLHVQGEKLFYGWRHQPVYIVLEYEDGSKAYCQLEIIYSGLMTYPSV